MPTLAAALSDLGLGQVNVKDPQFGAVGDGVADDWAAIQGAVDYALENGIAKVRLPEGIFLISDTIHLGYGVPNQQFSYVELEGAGATYVANSGATTIRPDFLDRPVINIQGARGSGVRRVFIEGTVEISNPQAQTLAWRADADNYVPAGAKDDANAPFCGICIDGYSGTAPADPYPTPTYPAFLGAPSGAYSRSFSSGFFVEDCIIEHTLIGIMVAPNSNSNADFLRVGGGGGTTTLQYLKSAVAIGSSQARSNDFSNLNVYGVHTIFDGISYGTSDTGNFGGTYDNVHANTYYRIFDVALNWSTPIFFTNYYSEVGMRIGDFGAGGGIIDFGGGVYDVADTDRFNANEEVWNEPVVTGGNGLRFRSVNFDFHRAGIWFDATDIEFDNCGFRAAGWEDALAGAELDAVEAFGSAVYGGIFITPSINKPALHARFQGGSIKGYDTDDEKNWHSIGSSDYVINRYDVDNFTRVHGVTITSASFSGRTLSATASLSSYYKAGDVIFASGGGATNWFVVTAYNSGTGAITMNALFNYKWDGATYTMLNSDVSPTAWYYFPKGALDVPVDRTKFLKITSGSAAVEVVDGAGAAAARPTEITVNSKPLWFHQDTAYLANTLPFPAVTTVNSVSANGFTMSANAQASGTWAMAPGIRRVK